MAGSTRFELAAGSPEGSAFASTYPNGPRGNYSGANLDRSGSFREGTENRALSSGAGTTRGASATSAEMPPSQFLMLEPITMGDQKFARSGDLRRAIGASHGTALEDHSFGAAHSKPPLIAPEEVKRFKAGMADTSSKARERVKRLNESIGKLDKYRLTLYPRKRRTDSTERSGGANMLKIGSQIHQNPSDLVTQRLEDRAKNVVLNKRVRTSIADVRSEGRNAVPSRQAAVVDKERDILRTGAGGSAAQVEEKVRGLPAAGEGWDKKMKRKRSVGTVVTRAMDGDRELKRPMHQKFSNDSRSRSTDTHGFGSGPSNGITGINNNKLDGASQPTPPNVRAIPRNELESVSFSNDRRERAAGIDKERVVYKGNNKLNVREDGHVGSPSPVTKGKASRAPRTGSAVANSSPNFSRTPGGLEGWEQTSGLNKVQPVGGPNNRKRPIPTGSSSPPMAQWVGQRPQKTRNRRANLVSPVSNHDEAQISSEGFSTPDVSTKITSGEANGSLLPRGASSNGQQFKMKFENVPSPARLSESEESGAGETKLKDKGMDNDEIEDRSVSVVPKVGPFILPTKNNKVKEEIGDGVRRQGRTGRGSSTSRACIPQMREKLENPGMTKPLQSVRSGPDKSESKSGRPPSKKLSDRKAFNRHGHALNSGSSDMTGESDDDHDDLVAAAKSAYDARYLACSGSFWKKIEPIFASVSSEDIAYLKGQLNFAEELDESLQHIFGADYNVLSELQQNNGLPSQFRERHVSRLNGVESKGPPWTLGSMDQPRDTDPLSGKFENVAPLYQRVLSALIEEEEMDDCNGEMRRGSFQYTSDCSPTLLHIDVEPKDGVRVLSEVESELDCRNQNQCFLDNFSCDGSTASNSFRSSSNRACVYNDEQWSGDDSLINSDIGNISGFSHTNLDAIPPAQMNNAVNYTLECQYEHMSLDDKLLLELQSIGLYPETVPDLTEGEEEISSDIAALKEELYRQVGRKKVQLCKLDEVIQKGREEEERYLEQSAMNKLVEMAYRKRMASRGSNASKNGVSKTSRQAVLAFVKRTIARCRKFEDTGESCFREPALRDIIFSASPCVNDAKLADGAEVHNGLPESRTSAVNAPSTLVGRDSPRGDKLDRGMSDTFQGPTHSSTQSFAKTEPITNRGKKKEVLLDDVTGSAASRASAALANTLLGGAKGRRSERERDQNKYGSTRNSVAKAGRPALGGFRGERKTKTKPKQKTAQLSMSGNGLLGRAAETSNPVYPSSRDSNGKVNDPSSKVSREAGFLSPGSAPQDSSKEAAEPADFTHMHEIDPIEDLGVSSNLGGQNDLSSWLSFDEDGLQDHDSMGLEIPMDDLSELQMLI